MSDIHQLNKNASHFVLKFNKHHTKAAHKCKTALVFGIADNIFLTDHNSMVSLCQKNMNCKQEVALDVVSKHSYKQISLEHSQFK